MVLKGGFFMQFEKILVLKGAIINIRQENSLEEKK